ncbi:sigma-70 family RNA polymerase sigma factor [Gemmiger formicilis]|uniref:RNA polymerase sigma factor n=1 Tax=Gemmiger formicilis TaxID=745368 RepID=UPI0019567481|nr:sigma-70 family RNA polymerase sigma factor [Gemmiger formicilis]MBM6717776.1 sigma-70 family RNA polymerase sigma factor [Gemmiger formicilis]
MAIPELESLYNTYKTPLYRYLLHLCRDPHRAEDLLADTFLRALRCLPAYRGEGSVKAWLFGLARNIWLEELRRSRPTLEYDDMLGLYMEDHLAEQADARRKLDRVRQLLAEKGPPASDVVALRARGYSYAEIAARLSITENSARVMEHRTRAWLKSTLQKEGLWND